MFRLFKFFFVLNAYTVQYLKCQECITLGMLPRAITASGHFSRVSEKVKTKKVYQILS